MTPNVLSHSRILLVAAGWHDETPSGANRVPTDFARFLARRGHSVAYLCMGTVGDTQPEICDGVEIWRYAPPTAPSPSIRNLWAHVRSAAEIARRVHARAAVNVVHGHSPLQYLGAIRELGNAVRRCYSCHSPFVEELKAHHGEGKLARKLALRAAARVEARIYRDSQTIHCLSHYTESLLARDYPRQIDGKTIVIPGWVDTHRFTPAADKQRLRSELGAPWRPDATTFFTLRRLVPRMGLDSLLEAVAALAPEFDFRVVIGGSGPDADRLARRSAELQVANRVSFLGRVAEDDLPRVFAAADCFVLPTRALECFGIIVLESYASGVPVIGVPVGAIPEVMGSEFADWLAAENSADALTHIMRKFLNHSLATNVDGLRRHALCYEVDFIETSYADDVIGKNVISD